MSYPSTIIYGSACSVLTVLACAWIFDGGATRYAQGFGGLALAIVVGAMVIGRGERTTR